MFIRFGTMPKSQLELEIERPPETDRNFHLGGRSFYFFDFDDNIAHLTTPLVIFNKKTNAETLLSSQEWAQVQSMVGKPGPWQDYFIDLDERRGSFRHFRDHDYETLDKYGLNIQFFEQDLLQTLQQPEWKWKGPSWDCFYHATFNQRPISLITARGHHPETLRRGIKSWVLEKILPHEPNFLSLFPVSRPEVRRSLGDASLSLSAAELKQRALCASVEKAFETYGYNPHHRFGVSDDDPKNIQMIFEELRRLKKKYPEVSFYLIETHEGQFIKHEVGLHHTESTGADSAQQLSFFD